MRQVRQVRRVLCGALVHGCTGAVRGYAGAGVQVLIDDRWQKRSTRARRLSDGHPAAGDTLRFYAALVEIQEDVLRSCSNAILPGSARFADQLDHGAALRALPAFLTAIAREAPDALVERLPSPAFNDHDRWLHRIEACWITGGREAWDANQVQWFILEALLQPFAEVIVGTSTPGTAGTPGTLGTSGTPGTLAQCPRCSGLPVVATLSEQAHGAKRALVCGFCLTEWPALRLVCPACGESRFEALPVFRAEEFDAVRVDACESCTTYVKTIDLTRDGAAMPIVDDLATLPLDLWAQERGYHRNRPNLLRL